MSEVAGRNAQPYPPHELTEVEEIELASAISFHFDANPECESERTDQFDVLVSVATRMIRRRNGVL